MATLTVTSQMTANQAATAAEVSSGAENEMLSSGYQQSYHEMSEQHVMNSDVLVQLKANLAQLEDLHMRLKFMMGELAYLLKKN